MAEQQGWASGWGQRIRDSLHNAAQAFRDHPIQTISRGVIGAMYGPAASAAAGAGFDRYNRAHDQAPESGTPMADWQGQNVGNSLGIPRYLAGDPGFTSPTSGIPLMNFGSSSQSGSNGTPWLAPDGILTEGQAEPTGGLPGITSPNTYTGRNPLLASMNAYDAGWRTGEGGSGLGGGWSTANGNRLQALFGDLGASGTGSLAGDGQALLPRFANEFGRARQNGRDAGEMAAPRAQKPLTGVSLTAKDYIRTHPEEWARMQQEMRSRGG